MKRIIGCVLLAALLGLGGCGTPEVLSASPEESIDETPVDTSAVYTDPANTQPLMTPTATSQAYPYSDEEGRMRYQLIINGNTVYTEHLPFSITGEEGAYYPLEDVLGFFNIPFLINESSRAVTGRVNGSVFKVQANVPKMTVGKTVLNSNVSPRYVNGCLYVPSFLFMELLGATVDFTPDRSGATLVTQMAIDAEKSTLEGLALDDNTFGDGNVQLTLEAEAKTVCAKLFLSDAVGKGQEVLTVFIKPHESTTIYFSAGAYILKLASGDTWISDEEAFGETGSYSSTEAFTFEEGGQYELKASSAQGDFHADSAQGFTGN